MNLFAPIKLLTWARDNRVLRLKLFWMEVEFQPSGVAHWRVEQAQAVADATDASPLLSPADEAKANEAALFHSAS